MSDEIQEEFEGGDSVDPSESLFDEAIESGVDDGEQAPVSRDEQMERLRSAAELADKRALMAQAELENARKRIRRDFEDQLRFASLPLVVDMLQVRDNLLRAIDAADSAADAAGLREGVAIVAKQLDDMLAKHSVSEIPAEGEQFDPNVHEAISQMPSAEPEGTITHVAQSGFRMHDRVVRPSQVVVSSGSG